MRRITYKTVEYDYKDFTEYSRHAAVMVSKGWAITNAYDIDEEDYKYHAQYTTGLLYNGFNAR